MSNNIMLKAIGKSFIKKAIDNKEIIILGKAEFEGQQGTLAELKIKLDNSLIAGKIFIAGQLEKDIVGSGIYAKGKQDKEQ